MKKTLLCSSIAAAIAVVTAPAALAGVEVSGQVNAALLFGGDIKDPEIVDNSGSGSRVRFKASKEVGGAKFYTRYEFQAQENSSFSADGGESFDTRYAEVGISGNFGKLSLGKGDGASNATAEATYYVTGNVLGGTPLSYFNNIGTLNRDNDANVGWTYFDGFSRNSRLRYDSPSFSGLSFAASLNSGDRTEIAARYRGDLGFAKATLFAGSADSANGENDRTMLSGGLLFPIGFNVSFSMSDRTQAEGPDLESQLFTIGYKVGKWAISADKGESGVDGENEITSIGFTYRPVKGVELYANNSSYDNGDGSSLSASFVGSRFKF